MWFLTRNNRKLLVLAWLFAALCLAAALSYASRAEPAPPPEQPKSVDAAIAPHKALYSMDVIAIQPGSPVTGLKGKMFFQWEDACEAWTTDHRFTIEYQYTDRPPVTVTSNFVSWEAKDGNRFHFTSESETDGIQDEMLRGAATRDDAGAGVAEYSEPEDLEFKLPKGFYFPSGHTLELIRRARSGQRIFNSVLFDGTDEDGPVEVNGFITEEVNVTKTMEFSDDVDTSLLEGRAWRMRLAFFSLAEGSDSTPIYEMEVLLHENGIVSTVTVEYRSFTIRQDLQALESLERDAC